ncbi:hypothetical protein U1Q18_036480 [Sarracenia purpurea var. burkii]
MFLLYCPALIYCSASIVRFSQLLLFSLMVVVFLNRFTWSCGLSWSWFGCPSVDIEAYVCAIGPGWASFWLVGVQLGLVWLGIGVGIGRSTVMCIGGYRQILFQQPFIIEILEASCFSLEVWLVAGSVLALPQCYSSLIPQADFVLLLTVVDICLV